jgi:integrase
MRAFIPWRRDYYSKFTKLPKNAKLHPTKTTLQSEMMLGKAIIRWAHVQGLRGKLALPTATFTAKRRRVRPAFEIHEDRRLWRTMQKRINDAGHARISRSREFLCDYVLVLANSGMRVGEANNLKLRDVMPFRDAKGRNNFRSS